MKSDEFSFKYNRKKNIKSYSKKYLERSDEYITKTDGEQKAVIKPKYKDKKNLKIAVLALINASIIAGIPISDAIYNTIHSNFSYRTVSNNLKRYGGADFLIHRSFDYALLSKHPLVSHLKESKTGIIKIGVDKYLKNDLINESLAECVEYINNIFSVINNKYKFVIGKYSQGDCDVYVKQNYYDMYEATTSLSYGYFFTSTPKAITVNISTDCCNYDKIYVKLIILHEFLHVLLNCVDMDYSSGTNQYDTEYISLLSYEDVPMIFEYLYGKYIKANKENNEDAKNKYSGFTSYMPVDLATLISVYGDSSKPANVKKYEALLKQCMTNCRDVLGFKDYYKYTSGIEWLNELDSMNDNGIISDLKQDAERGR